MKKSHKPYTSTDLHKLRHIKRIHKMKQSKGASSSSKATGIFEIGMPATTRMVDEMQDANLVWGCVFLVTEIVIERVHLQGLDISGLPELEVMLIEVVIRSALSLDEKMVFLWETLSEEYDKDADSKYMEYQELILTKLEESPDLKGKISPRAWEDFIKKLPKINRRVLDHIWAITKQDKNSTLMYEVSRFAKKEIRDIAVNYMLEMGQPKVLPLVAGLVSGPEEFKASVIPAAIKIFKSLTQPTDQIEETVFKESVKRQISPMIMCLQVDRMIFRDMISYYPQLPNQAKDFLKSQMDRILRIVLSCKGENERPDEKQTQEEMHFLYKKLKEEHTDLANTADFIEIIQLFKDFVRNQGQEPKNHLSKVLHQLILLNKDVEFLVQSCKELLDLHLIGLLCDLNSEDLVSQADLLAISDKTSKPVFDLLMETIFYPDQEKEPEKWKQLYLLQQKLFFLKPIADLTSGPIGKAMISQLNKLSVMKGDPSF